jgi:hypothetical protein
MRQRLAGGWGSSTPGDGDERRGVQHDARESDQQRDELDDRREQRLPMTPPAATW